MSRRWLKTPTARNGSDRSNVFVVLTVDRTHRARSTNQSRRSEGEPARVGWKWANEGTAHRSREWACVAATLHSSACHRLPPMQVRAFCMIWACIAAAGGPPRASSAWRWVIRTRAPQRENTAGLQHLRPAACTPYASFSIPSNRKRLGS